MRTTRHTKRKRQWYKNIRKKRHLQKKEKKEETKHPPRPREGGTCQNIYKKFTWDFIGLPSVSSIESTLLYTCINHDAGEPKQWQKSTK